MKKKFVKVMAAMTVAVLIVGNTTVVAEAHHSKSSRAAVQGATCYQNGYCTENGSCDVNGVCQYGGSCSGTACYQDGSCDVDGVCQNGGSCDGTIHHASTYSGSTSGHHGRHHR